MTEDLGAWIPAGLTVFTDRDLGSRIVPDRLREVGLSVVTISEHYGQARAQQVADVEWIAEVCSRGWVIFGQDQRVRRNPAEKAAVLRHRARMFCVTSGTITGRQAAERYVENLPAILRAAQRPGPFVYGVHPHHIEPLRLK